MPRFLLLALAVGLAGSAEAQGVVVYVDRDATGAGDGTSWADAYSDLQEAIAATANGDAIWVAEGAYRPTAGTNRALAFNLRGGVALYGGFDGTEATLEQRDPAAHVTVLSGDIGAGGDSLDNSNTIVRSVGTGAGTRLDGFTVTGAQGGNGIFVEGSLAVARCRITSNYSSTRGGGLVAFSVALTIEDTAFEGNRAEQAGGGVYVVVGAVVVARSTFHRNAVLSTAAGAGGGGLYLEGTANADVRDVAFVGNAAERGGGLYSWDEGLAVVRSRFVRNAGGGLFVNRRTAVYNSSFLGNTAVAGFARGGGIAAGDGADSLFVYNSAFVGNRAGRGGGLSLGPGVDAVVTNVTFAANEATVNGDAALADAGAHGDLQNAVLWQSEVAPAASWTLDHATAADPLYLAYPSSGPDGTWGTADDDYGDLRPDAGSPALDAGLSAHLPPDAHDLDVDGDTAEPLPLDLADQPRVDGPTVDLGAYERQSPVGTVGGEPTRGTLWLGVSPNPTHRAATVTLVVPAPAPVLVALYDALGRRVAIVHNGPLAAGSHPFPLLVGPLAPGAYVLRASTPDGAASRRVAVAR
jgi:hypothetical protein